MLNVLLYNIYNIMIHYLILVHNNLDQLEMLIKKLKTSNSEVYVHLDKKIKEFKKIKNIHYIENRQSISWGGTSMIKAEIIWFSEIYKKMKKWDHIVLISWQCYPIKKIQYIENYIESLKNKSCMTYDAVGDFIGRLDKYFFYDNNFHLPKIIDDWIFALVWLFVKLGSPHRVPAINHAVWVIVNLFLPRRKYLINNYELYKWDQWMVLSYEHIKWILEFLETKKWKKYLSSFEYTSCSDEMFFQIMMLNDEKIKKEINNELLWYIEREKEANSPNTLTIKDLDKITKSDKLFARKFNINVDRAILEKLDEL